MEALTRHSLRFLLYFLEMAEFHGRGLPSIFPSDFVRPFEAVYIRLQPDDERHLLSNAPVLKPGLLGHTPGYRHRLCQ